MKKSSDELLNYCGVLAFVTSIAFNFASAAVPRSDHDALTLDIQNSIEWSQHVIKEVEKGDQLVVKHANVEIAHLKGWLEKMSKAYTKLAKQQPSETTEKHFIAVKTHQKKAEGFVNTLSIQLNNPNLNFNEIKKIAKNIKFELEAAASSHLEELNEIERQ